MPKVALLDTHCHIDQYERPDAVIRSLDATAIITIAGTASPSDFVLLRRRFAGERHLRSIRCMLRHSLRRNGRSSTIALPRHDLSVRSGWTSRPREHTVVLNKNGHFAGFSRRLPDATRCSASTRAEQRQQFSPF